MDGLAFSAVDAAGRSMVVIVTQGHGDEEAVEQAVAAQPAYLGLVGSHRRGASVLGYLADRGVPSDQLDRIRVPAGLDRSQEHPPELPSHLHLLCPRLLQQKQVPNPLQLVRSE